MSPKMDKDEMVKEIVLDLFYTTKGDLGKINTAIDAKFKKERTRSITLFEKFIQSRIGMNTKSLKMANMEITAVEAIYLSRYPYLEELESLDLRQNFIGDVGLQAIAQSPQFANLKVLDVRNNQITRIGALALAETTLMPLLESVDLRSNKLGKRWEDKLKEGDNFPHLTIVKAGQ